MLVVVVAGGGSVAHVHSALEPWRTPVHTSPGAQRPTVHDIPPGAVEQAMSSGTHWQNRRSSDPVAAIAWQTSPAAHPPAHTGKAVSSHGRSGIVDVVTVSPRQLVPQASQQLGHAFTVPPWLVQAVAVRRIRQRERPFRCVQQVTAPGRPHVDAAAQRRAAAAHGGASVPESPAIVVARQRR